jgi:SRSO17 transposase
MSVIHPCRMLMDIPKQFEHYMTYLAEGLGHADRHSGMSGY